MKITLVESEIKEAIRQYILGHFNIKEGMAITMEFTATRGDDGLTANINIAKEGPMAAVATTTVVQVPSLPVRETAAAPKPEPVQPVAQVIEMAVKPIEVAKPTPVDPVPAADPEVPVGTAPTSSEAETVTTAAPTSPAPGGEPAAAPVVARRTLFQRVTPPKSNPADAGAEGAAAVGG